MGYSWSTLLWHWCYYLHRSRDALSPVCGIFLLQMLIGSCADKCSYLPRQIQYLPRKIFHHLGEITGTSTNPANRLLTMPKRRHDESEAEYVPASLLQALEQNHTDLNLKLKKFEDSLYKDKSYLHKKYPGWVSFFLLGLSFPPFHLTLEF